MSSCNIGTGITNETLCTGKTELQTCKMRKLKDYNCDTSVNIFDVRVAPTFNI